MGGRILKVDHAGEHGAVSIYSGQILLARLTAPKMVADLRALREHERAQRAVFWNEMSRRGVRRCRSHWLCAAGGFALGVLTGLMGAFAIAATTVAVERVVLRHLDHQLSTLGASDPAAVAAISSIVAEEREHHDRSALHRSAAPFWSKVLEPIVAAATEAVIWLGMRP